MYKRLVLIKLGGSLITDKRREDIARHDVIKLCANEVGDMYRSLNDTHYIIGTGAGSFAHIRAHKYHLREGAKTATQLYGMSVTHNSVRRLNGMVTDQLTSVGVPAFAVSPASFITLDNAQPYSVYMDSIMQLLLSGCIPLLHGDTILDKTRGTTILSTEKVLQVCLENLRSLYEEIIVIYCMDTDGLLDSSGKTVTQLKPDDELFTHQSSHHDVTGSIVGKVKSARLAANIADRVYLVSGKNEGAIMGAIEDRRVGTKIQNVGD